MPENRAKFAKAVHLLPMLLVVLCACRSGSPENRPATSTHFALGASAKIEGTDALAYGIAHESGSIEYLKIGTDTTVVKPTLLFLQGSLPVPLVIDFEEFKHLGVPFDYADLIKDCHLVIISMPHTPLEAKVQALDEQYCYVTDLDAPNSFDKNYLKHNHLQAYAARTHAVIDHLLAQNWTSKDALHLVGHSQGAKIAAVVAAGHPQVSSAAMLGFNAFGRFDETIRRERQRLKSKEIGAEEYLKSMESHYGRWRSMQSDPDNFENGNLNWTSFSIDYLPYLLRIDVPIFVGYGTEDLGAENCDLLPMHFIQNGKDNLTLKPYIGLEHNFFELSNGQPDYSAGGRWTEVIKDVMAWQNELVEP